MFRKKRKKKMDEGKRVEIIDEFEKIYTKPCGSGGGRFPAIDYAFEELGKILESETIFLNERVTVLLNKENKTALFTRICNRSCE